VSTVAYWPHGAMEQYNCGNGLDVVANYNSRLQMVSTWHVIDGDPSRFLWLSYPNWGGTNNNGNLQSNAEYAGGPAPWTTLPNYSQNFTYDNLNRLTSASDSGGWSKVLGTISTAMAGWRAGRGRGWMWWRRPAGGSFNTKNQIGSSPYDAAGNMLALLPGGAMRFSYDAENRQLSETNTSGLSATYYYDGDGQRIQKAWNNGQTIVYVYDALGKLAAEYDLRNSGPPPCTTCYLSYDHLGSLRMVTDQNANVVARHDYIPFGEEIPGGIAGRSGQFGASDSVSQRFTGKERDTETSLDYFGARYYAAGMGRFMGADPGGIGAEASDPQSWNAYGYAGNDPLNQTDPDGLDYHVCIEDGKGGQQCTNIANDQAFQQAAQNPGAGLTVTGDAQSGAIYATDQNGNQVQVGTYEHFVGPGTEGGGLQPGYAIELAGAGLATRALLGTEAAVGEGLAGALGRLFGSGAAEDAAAAAGSAFRAGVNEVLQRAGSVAGNQQIRVASEDVARQAADEFLGPGSREITQQYGNRAGQVVGRISADGRRVVRVDTNAAAPHYNFVNKTSAGNLHVYF
jgi:RHS repeat-associated protein